MCLVNNATHSTRHIECLHYPAAGMHAVGLSNQPSSFCLSGIISTSGYNLGHHLPLSSSYRLKMHMNFFRFTFVAPYWQLHIHSTVI